MTTASKTPPPQAQPPARPPVQPRRPPNKPNSPPIDPPSKGLAAELLTAIDSSLIALLGVAVSLPDSEDRMEICGQEVLKHRLRMARKAIADLRQYAQTPAQLCPRSAGPDRAGGPPAPGAGTFSLPQPPAFSVGAALLTSLARRAD